MDETTALKKFDRLAHKLATYYFDRSAGRYEYDDLYQAARLGIVNAARTFNPDLGFEFITHAWNCAKNSVKKHIRDDRGLIRVPQAADASSYVTVVDSETAATLLEFEAAADDTSASEKTIVLNQAMADIPERQRDAIRLIYLEGLTYEEASLQLDVSKQYVHKLTALGLENLRAVLGDVPQML
jgi:RNA polymerase sigma factor (sigma-70 family)